MSDPKDASSHWSQVRRCHKCGHTHEVQGDRVMSCPKCAAKFAPFYFADTTPAVLRKRPKKRNAKINFRPLIGIAEWWSDSLGTQPTQKLPNA